VKAHLLGSEWYSGAILAMMFFEEIKAFNRAIKNRREHFRCGFEDEMI
jgi:hypothetical protein